MHIFVHTHTKVYTQSQGVLFIIVMTKARANSMKANTQIIRLLFKAITPT